MHCVFNLRAYGAALGPVGLELAFGVAEAHPGALRVLEYRERFGIEALQLAPR